MATVLKTGAAPAAKEAPIADEAEGRNAGFLHTLGPGLITGASDDDPSGIGTYSQAGAQLGFFDILDDGAVPFPLMVCHPGDQRADREDYRHRHCRQPA